MKQYKFINNIAGLAVFVVAALVYIITSEPTASYWDCSEYISTAYKLQVGHPPGAPFFQLMGRFFSLFAFGNVHLVARMVNTMSALASGLTILFLFWSVTALAKKVVQRSSEVSMADTMIIIAAGLVGALAYTFSDSFWFSAVEGEVYATSSFFTAFVFWSILKWETVADQPGANRWLVLIAFMMGLSIGVHLLNLLAIPAITLVFYFKKYKTTRAGTLLAFAISVLLLAAIMYGIIPQVVEIFAKSELLFVNGFGMPFHSGTVFFFILLIAAIVFGLLYTEKSHKAFAWGVAVCYVILIFLVLYCSASVWEFIVRLLIMAALTALIILGRRKKEMLKTAILGFAFILIGYSSFMALVVRSNAGTPLNENAPKDAISLLSYLNREQYGDWPLVYGPYYNAPLDTKKPYTDGNPLYARDDVKKKYVVVDQRKNSVANYDSRFMTLFPRMWDGNSDQHISGYKSWGEVKGVPMQVKKMNDKDEIIYKPTFVENLRYFFTYQLGHMYFRYFMWNFAGKQNDIQGNGGLLNGNWISGIPFLDNMRLGPQSNLPEPLANNKGRNVFYLLPLILGIVGFFVQLNKDMKGFLVIALLFVFTGIAINVYLNPVPYQPRERDYAYAASFYAFAFWIGLGVIGLFKLLKLIIKPKVSAVIAFFICLFLVPGLMAKEGWNDHDRSNRYTVVDVASDYLNSCAPNAILFTLGDNDTFPLWYAQEVEGIRTDVKIVNLSLLDMDWYIDQMKLKTGPAEPLPISLDASKYIASKRDYVLVYDDTALVKADTNVDVRTLINFATSDDESTMLNTYRGKFNFVPTHNFLLPVDTNLVRKNGSVPPEFRDSVNSAIVWTYSDYGLQKNAIVLLDMLSNLQWQRPVYFATTTGDDAYVGLTDYLQLEGLADRLVPFRCKSTDGQTGRVNTEAMFDNLIHKFKWGNMNNPSVYLDETNIHNTYFLRVLFGRLANALVLEGKLKEAGIVCDKCVEEMPDNCSPYDQFMVPVANAYYKINEPEKANKITRRLTEYSRQELKYYAQFTGGDAAYLSIDKKQALDLLDKIHAMSGTYKQADLEKQTQEIINLYK